MRQLILIVQGDHDVQVTVADAEFAEAQSFPDPKRRPIPSGDAWE